MMVGPTDRGSVGREIRLQDAAVCRIAVPVVGARGAASEFNRQALSRTRRPWGDCVRRGIPARPGRPERGGIRRAFPQHVDGKGGKIPLDLCGALHHLVHREIGRISDVAGIVTHFLGVSSLNSGRASLARPFLWAAGPAWIKAPPQGDGTPGRPNKKRSTRLEWTAKRKWLASAVFGGSFRSRGPTASRQGPAKIVEIH